MGSGEGSVGGVEAQFGRACQDLATVRHELARLQADEARIVARAPSPGERGHATAVKNFALARAWVELARARVGILEDWRAAAWVALCEARVALAEGGLEAFLEEELGPARRRLVDAEAALREWQAADLGHIRDGHQQIADRHMGRLPGLNQGVIDARAALDGCEATLREREASVRAAREALVRARSVAQWTVAEQDVFFDGVGA